VLFAATLVVDVRIPADGGGVADVVDVRDRLSYPVGN
jgi:hypothetical protein